MSEDDDAAVGKLCCASCGIAEVDDIKLKECDDCDLVKYCSDECEQDDKSHHKKACKERAAELRDEILFKQPESSHRGDCPICCLPVPLDAEKSIIQTCCSEIICKGCDHANKMREIEGKLSFKCPFCRRPVPREKRFRDKQRMKRLEVNDPVAMRYKGKDLCKKGEYDSAFGYLMKADHLGDVDAQYSLAGMYRKGHGVEKDEGMEMYHLEEAAIGGHPFARHNLGVHEWNNDNEERAVKHWIIAATQGDDGSIKALMLAFRRGLISKEEFAAALRANQAAVDATKSPQREAAEEFYRNAV